MEMRLEQALAAALVLALGVGPAEAAEIGRPSAAMRAGMDLLAGGEHRAAARLLSAHLATHPHDLLASALLAEATGQGGDTRIAAVLQSARPFMLAGGRRGGTATIASDKVLAALPGAQIINGDATWSDSELAALASALSALSHSDRQRLSGTRFVRQHAPSDGAGLAPRGGFEAAARAEIGLDGTRTIYLYDAASGLSAAAGPSGGPIEGVLFHEVGHLALTFAPDKVSEFGTLGFNERGEPHSSGFYSAYAATGPEEDHAEAYRALYADPDGLLTSSPAKFLYANYQARRFTASDVRKMASRAGLNLADVATDIVLAGRMRQDTAAEVLGYHQMRADTSAILADARAILASATARPLERAMALVVISRYNGVTGPIGALLSGDQVWSQLGVSEKQVITTKSFVRDVAADIRNGLLATRGLANDIRNEVYKNGFEKFFTALLDPGERGNRVRAAFSVPDAELAQSFGLVEQVLSYEVIWPDLHPTVKRLLADRTARGAEIRGRLKAIVTGEAFARALESQKKQFPSQGLQKNLDLLSTENALLFFRYLDGQGPLPPMDPSRAPASDPFVYVATVTLQNIYNGVAPAAGTAYIV